MSASKEDIKSAFDQALDEAHPRVDKEAFQGFLANVFHNWTSKDPIPMPTLPTHTFAQSSIQVGRIAQDLPVQAGSVISDKRKKNAKAYLMVKRIEGDSTGFLWCDGDGKPVRRNWIKKTRGLVVSHAKEELVEEYNSVEQGLVDGYNHLLRLAHARMRVVKFTERESTGVTEPPAREEGDEWKSKGYVFCDEDDPELN